MVDAGGSDAFWNNGYKWAYRTSQMLAEYDVYWFEEPVRPDSIEDYRELRLRSPVPISGGEVLTRRQVFKPWLTTRTVCCPFPKRRVSVSSSTSMRLPNTVTTQAFFRKAHPTLRHHKRMT